MSYPEKIPNFSTDNFVFSFDKARSALPELQKINETLEERIEKIVSSEKFFISDYPILRQIMMLSPDKNQLKLLSKALDRLSELVDSQKTINQKLVVFKMLQEDPDWFTLSFGDFSKEIDSDLQSLFSSDVED